MATVGMETLITNYAFTVAGSDMTVSYCAGTCDAECTTADPCGDGVCADDEDCSTCSADCGECQDYLVTFGFDGLEDCGQVNISGTWDNWSGWGVNPADHPDYTISLAAGDYEFKYLCIDTSVDGWWDDVWGNSVAYGAPVDDTAGMMAMNMQIMRFSVDSDADCFILHLEHVTRMCSRHVILAMPLVMVKL